LPWLSVYKNDAENSVLQFAVRTADYGEVKLQIARNLLRQEVKPTRTTRPDRGSGPDERYLFDCAVREALKARAFRRTRARPNSCAIDDIKKIAECCGSNGRGFVLESGPAGRATAEL
jgi:hypothetical protein